MLSPPSLRRFAARASYTYVKDAQHARVDD